MRKVTLWGCVALGLLLVGVGCTKETTLSSAGPSIVPSPARVMAVTVTGLTLFYQRGQTTQLTAAANLSNGFTEDRTSSATWSSDNTGVATVSSSGLVTAGNEGTATITATVGETRGTLAVTVKYGYRAPDPPPGQRLPMPASAYNIVLEVKSQYPAAWANSCQDQGGSWEFMDRLIDRLRTIDLRYGYNGRRGDASFVGRDEVAYHYGAGPSENSRDVYVWDVIGGHCGPTPQPGWLDVTDLGGIWLTRGRF